MRGGAVTWLVHPWLTTGSSVLSRSGRIYLVAALLTVLVLPAMIAAFGSDGWLWDLTLAVLVAAPLGIVLCDQLGELLDRARVRRTGRRMPTVQRLGFMFVGLAAGVFAGYAVIIALPLGARLGTEVLIADYRRNMLILTSVVVVLGIAGASLWYRGEAFRQKSAAAIANFNVLRVQTQPHFLFNALSSLKQLIAEDPALAGEATQRLADLYRLILRAAGEPTSPLDDELAIIRSYLEIERLRFGERLRFSIDAPASLGALRVPSLVLQTLVENAVKHGIAKAREGGEVRVQVARRADGWLELVVANTGAAYASDAARDPTLPPPTGLAITRERLALMYGPASGFSIEGDATAGTRVRFAVSGAPVGSP